MPSKPEPESVPVPPSSFTGKLDLSAFTCSISPKSTDTIAVSTSGAATAPPATRITRSRSSQKSASPVKPPLSTKRRHCPPPASPPSARKKPRRNPPSSYAPPSTYAHLSLLPDALGPNLLVLFVGLNPGIQTARSGHAYAHPSNLFWKLLHASGITPRRVAPHEDAHMPREYRLGLTNIVARPSRNGAELSRAEMDAGVAALHEKARLHRPLCMCIVGKSIWESIWRVRHGRPLRKTEFRYGWQDETENMGAAEEWPGARVFVATSTSGLAATMKPAEKEAVWRQLGEWVEQQRAEEMATGI
ncbi:hypothetical protein TD95_000077 [Thielaviopsis punctulata]|uniref:Uracil-DNA glycosylase-like domain-containing protein n=1 Tax=Thielaviopsis punctulata TaxID=72032 RepID=A0A0F4Z8N0_9PEZI|nr:hypothetical protein TD95_000077 [Thielaviopsis punctulata]